MLSRFKGLSWNQIRLEAAVLPTAAHPDIPRTQSITERRQGTQFVETSVDRTAHFKNMRLPAGLHEPGRRVVRYPTLSSGIEFTENVERTHQIVSRGCGVKLELRHRTFAGLAARGKTSRGWFCGFKLQQVFNQLNQIVALKITGVTRIKTESCLNGKEFCSFSLNSVVISATC
jgi:hypothetical protein